MQQWFLVGKSRLITTTPPQSLTTTTVLYFNHSHSSPVVAFWIVFVCVCAAARRDKDTGECLQVVCLCVCVRRKSSVCRFQMEVWNHPGLTATQLWRFAPNTSQEFSAWVTRGDERRWQGRCGVEGRALRVGRENTWEGSACSVPSASLFTSLRLGQLLRRGPECDCGRGRKECGARVRHLPGACRSSVRRRSRAPPPLHHIGGEC